MPRAAREDFDGAWHHVMNRGAGRQAIFSDDADRRRFLIELREASHAIGGRVGAYCLMATHYHFVLFTPRAGLSRAMQQLSAAYTRAFNQRHERDGPLFRGRFKSVLIESDAQLIHATLYVHRNPVEAGVVALAEDWSWSSAGAYIGAQASPEWLAAGLVLEMLGGRDPMAEYKRLLDDA